MLSKTFLALATPHAHTSTRKHSTVDITDTNKMASGGQSSLQCMKAADDKNFVFAGF